MPSKKQRLKGADVTPGVLVQEGNKLLIDRIFERQIKDYSRKKEGESVQLGVTVRKDLTKLFWIAVGAMGISSYYIVKQVWRMKEWYFLHTLMRQLFNVSIVLVLSLYILNTWYHNRYQFADEAGKLLRRVLNRRSRETPGAEDLPTDHPQYPLISVLPDAPASQVWERSGEGYARQVNVAFRRVGLIDDPEQKIDILEVEDGPTAAKITISLPTGMRLSKVQAAANDLSAAFGSPSLQVIGGGRVNSAALIISHQNRQTVTLKSLLGTPEFAEIANKVGIPIIIGVDPVGTPMLTSFNRTPHLLVAGASQSGKSVWLTQEIIALLACRGPDTLRLILIDPKKVELTPFTGLPHLAHDVVTEESDILAVLDIVCREMDARYQLFQKVKVRNIGRYNAKAPVTLPYLLTVFDELADVMLSAGKDLTPIIQRIVQLGRAAGVHLILATQRPSVDVIPGVIKANLPSRVVFRLVTQADYSTVLDRDPGVKLLGNGDGLALIEGEGDLIRIQGACVSPPGSDEEADLERILQAVQRQYQDTEPGSLVIRDAFGASLAPKAPKPGSGPKPGKQAAPETDQADDPLLHRLREMVAQMVTDDGAETLPSLAVLAQALGVRKQAVVELAQSLTSAGWLAPQGERRPYRIALTQADAQAWLDGGGQADPFRAPEGIFEAPDDFSLF